MVDHPHLVPSCRLALAALLHDLGKFAERAGLQIDANTLAANQHLYCPRQGVGRQQWFSHQHAAYTGIAADLIEPWLPPMTGDDMAPFAAWNTASVDDSLINAAAQHHSPRTFLQWIIATADRVASGFEREQFEQYNQAKEEKTSTGKTHYTARQLTLFEQIRLDRTDKPAFAWRYPLAPLSPKSIFPVKAVGYEQHDKIAAQKEYQALWEGFIAGLQRIPESHRAQLPLWLDHFDSLWACYTHAIPSATAFGTKPEVSLYDHSKAVAALAVALWRYHQERSDDFQAVTPRMQHRADWDENKFLLIQGDLQGIQDFIFASGGETQKHAAKLLRGRSFYVSLLTECAALRLLEALGLPSTSQIINAAGKFLLVAPNTPATLAAVDQVRAKLDQWFLKYSFGQSGLGIATLPACCNDFLPDRSGHRRFGDLMRRLFAALEVAKLRRFDLCGAQPPAPVFEGFLDRFTLGEECQIDGRSPAEVTLNGLKVSILAADQIAIGRYLASFDRILITRQSPNHHSLRLPVFGYSIQFTGDEEGSGKFGPEARSGNLRRAWDFSLPGRVENESVWHGYARRFINAYVPRWETLPNDWELGKYRGRDMEEEPPELGDPKTFNHLACEDRTLNEKGRPVGISALMTLKGDVDNLGRIFQGGLTEMTFAKMAGLSRQMNAFFTLYLPWLCQSRYRNCYTVFAGGDDFFLIGPWKSQMALARELRTRFGQYTAENPELHFSAALSLTKPGLPVRSLAELAEEILEKAKGHNPKSLTRPPKDSIGCFRETVFWTELDQLIGEGGCLPNLKQQTQDLKLSAGYLYDLLRLTDMAAALEEDRKLQEQASKPAQEKREIRIENALWLSRFAYQTRRLLERQRGLDDAERRRRQQELAQVIVEQGIKKFNGAYRIALFVHLYENRD